MKFVSTLFAGVEYVRGSNFFIAESCANSSEFYLEQTYSVTE